MKINTFAARLPAVLLLTALQPAAAMAAPKAGDDASQEPAAINYCSKQGEVVKSATFTSASKISVTCTRQPTRGTTKMLSEVPEGAQYTEVKGASSTTEYNWTLPATLFVVTLAILGNGDSTSGTTP